MANPNSSNRAKKARRLCALGLGFLIAMTATQVAADQMEAGAASDKAFARRICSDIMLMRQGTTQFAACSDSLTQTLAFLSQNSSMTVAFTQCQSAGLPLTTPAFATCVLDRHNELEDSPEPSGAVESVVVTAGKLSFPSQLKRAPFTEKTPKEKRRTIEYACAQLSLPPGLLAFSHCVSDLSLSLAEKMPE
jgi:hypothetical protein